MTNIVVEILRRRPKWRITVGIDSTRYVIQVIMYAAHDCWIERWVPYRDYLSTARHINTDPFGDLLIEMEKELIKVVNQNDQTLSLPRESRQEGPPSQRKDVDGP